MDFFKSIPIKEIANVASNKSRRGVSMNTSNTDPRETLKTNTKAKGLGLNCLISAQTFSDEIKELISINNLPEAMLLNKHTRFVIPKSNKFKKTFDIFIDFLVIYSVLSSLYFLAFVSRPQSWIEFDYFIWVMFVADFSLNFFTEFLNREQKKVRNLKLIAIHYIRTWFFLDLLAILPLSLTGNPNAEDFCKLTRILKMKRLLKKVNINYTADKIAGFFYSSENREKKNFRAAIQYFWDLFRELLTMLFVTYCLACLWWFYVNLVIRRKGEMDNFIYHFDVEGLSMVNKFIKTWYFIFTTIMTVGYGDFYATNKYEMGFAIVLIVAGPTWFAFTMGKAINLIDKMQKIGGKADKMGQLNIWISNIEHQKKLIPVDLKEKINLHYFSYWKNDRLGSMINLAKETEESFNYITHPLLKQLPETLRNMIIEYVFDDLFYSYKFFFKNFNEAKYKMAMFFQPRVYPDNFIILATDETPHEIVFKTAGKLEIGLQVHGEYKKIITTNEKFIVGDYYALNNLQSYIQFKSLETVHGYSIPTFVIMKILKSYPDKVEHYLDFSSKIHERLHDLGMDNCTRVIIENDQPKSRRRSTTSESTFSPVKGYILPNKKTILTEDPIFKKIRQVNEKINCFKESRKKNILNLKDALADHITRNEV